ncbi:hypothetical protein NliqN6_0520 [Naganishia liquefaciens]|uniref:Uncharacterized protein n=1 Tax=Naganishia liquefaciens TaxID=104408 RepID=A0A8H3TN68_9TREE|nr:hypothetical protein NliqN6_0520 [Naganishia liquefaciens]
MPVPIDRSVSSWRDSRHLGIEKFSNHGSTYTTGNNLNIDQLSEQDKLRLTIVTSYLNSLMAEMAAAGSVADKLSYWNGLKQAASIFLSAVASRPSNASALSNGSEPELRHSERDVSVSEQPAFLSPEEALQVQARHVELEKGDKFTNDDSVNLPGEALDAARPTSRPAYGPDEETQKLAFVIASAITDYQRGKAPGNTELGPDDSASMMYRKKDHDDYDGYDDHDEGYYTAGEFEDEFKPDGEQRSAPKHGANPNVTFDTILGQPTFSKGKPNPQ